MKNIKIHPFAYFFITILYLEILTKIVIAKHFIDSNLIYMLIFSLPFILLLTIIAKAFNKKVNKIISLILVFIITVYFEIQYIFFNLFSVPFSFSTISLANQALDFTNIIKDAIIAHLFTFILILIPFILGLIFNKLLDTTRYHKESIISLIIMLIISYLSTYLFLIPFNDNSKYAKELYYNIDDQVSLIDKFGMLTYTKVDIKRQIFGYETKLVIEEEEPIKVPEITPGEIDYGFNELDIDFSNLTSNNKTINKLNSFMAKQQASNKTKYTGMFKGKNLIFILAEGFNEVAVDEVRTPTLYKMINGGFVFNNFYSPVFLSTTGGEFQATVGLIPTQDILGTWKREQPTIAYGLGNIFGKIGYQAQSYHDWTYTYYKRNKTMETLGFNNYTGCGNGLEKKMNCDWLPFDSEMVNATYEDYMKSDKNFVTYYVTVSGHSPYEAGDNIAQHYKEYIEDLDYDKNVKYYLAAQMELDKMLETLIARLEETGKLKDTVIALVGDHYPYTLSIDQMNEVATYEKDETIEVNKSNFILWNSEMSEPIQVDKVGSQIDVLPTLLNLFGIDYDSRLILGKDILSDSEGIAIFSNRSWTTDYGSYDSMARKYTSKKELEGITEKEYIKRINNKVANYFSVSKMIIDTNYYTYVLGSE